MTELKPLNPISPLVDGALYVDGTSTQAVSPGTSTYLQADGRLPAFVGLASRAGGEGWYAENPEGMTVHRALEAAKLDFTVHFGDSLTRLELPATITATGVTPARTITVEDGPWRSTVGVWPDGTARCLGKVRSRYQIIQNTEVAEFGEAIIERSGATIVAAGSYGNPLGQRTYMAFKLPETVMLAGQDPHELFFTVLNSHDGGGWSSLFAPLRLRCTNQTNMTFGSSAQRHVMRHTGDMADKLAVAKSSLAKTFTWVEKWKEASEILLRTPMTHQELVAFVDKMMPTPSNIRTKRGEQNWADRRAAIIALAENADTNDFGRGTRYAAYQAVTEFLDHSPTKRPDSRWAAIMDGSKVMDGVKDQAARMLLAV